MKKHAKKIITALLVVALLVPTVAMIYSSAADNSYPVELAFNNLFVFEKWANNELSTTIIPQDENDPYGKLEADIEAGSVKITKYKDAPESYGGIYTAHSGDAEEPANNANYYAIDVNPSTTYTFSYTLENTNYVGFNAIVFYFDAENKYISLDAAGASTLNGENSWNFTTPSNADRIQIRFTVSNNNNGGTISGDVKDIIICESKLITPENIFSFRDWANNENSNVLASDYNYDQGTHNINTAAGSISFTATGTIFTNFVLGSVGEFYTMAVEPNTTYSISYNLINSTLSQAGVAVAWHDESGGLIDYSNLNSTNSNGPNTHSLVTPYNAATMQIAFGAFHSGTTGTGTFNDIKVCNTGSIFSLRDWAGNAYSNLVPTGGELNADPKTNTVTFTSTVHGNPYFTNYDLSSDANFYTADVEPSTAYTYSYDLAINGASGSIYFQPYFAEFTENGGFVKIHNYISPNFGKNQYTFTTDATTSRIMVVFSFHHTDPENTGNCTWNVGNITLLPKQNFEDITGAPHRQVFEYTHKEDELYYGELPTATAPDGYVFGGWYTGENGTGERITPETAIHYNSFTVYSNFEIAVDKLEIATPITKDVYTVGEKLDTTGLSLKATVNNDDGTISTFNINSDIYCTPVHMDTVGTQTITAHYGGQTVTFTVTVKENSESSIIFNGVEKTVLVANKNYVINEDVSAFNRYEISYSTNAYVKGVMTFNNGITEEFFLEPSDNGKFASYIDDFVHGNTYNKVVAVKFTCLDNEFGNFQLKSVTTTDTGSHDATTYFINDEYKLGVALEYGGAVSELYDIDDDIRARVYAETDPNGNATTRTQVDYKNKLDENYTAPYSAESTSVNLINKLDRGRYLQQSYYGTFEKPYVTSEFNRNKWNYNPVQGGNVAEEASKVVDYEITDTYIYVKARPLDWAKWSDEHALSGECNHLDTYGNPIHTEALWGEGYITDTYVEAWYYFENGMIKVTNRKVDYSGLPEHYTTQEMPALYIVEPLNHFVYNDVTADEAWAKSYDELTFVNDEEPEFWGIAKEYSEYHYPNPTPDKDKNDVYDAYIVSHENWAAFTASEDEDSFGVGIYSPGITDLFYGVMPQIYAETADYEQTDIKHYRHATTVDPAPEMPTSYIAPVDYMTFKSYDPTSYTYYLTTGTAEEIYNDFRSIGDKEAEVELAKTKIAVPETVYLNPADSKNPQFYVNNVMDEHNYYEVETEAKPDETNMYFGIHVDDAVSFTVNVTNVTDSTNDIILGNADGTGNREGEVISFDASQNDTFISENGFSLRLSTALEANETATAKWDITVTLNNGSTETYTVYTVLYAPMKTIGAVAESRRNANVNNEISTWITGANGVDHSQRSPLGSFKGDIHDSGYFKADPLYNGIPTSGGSSESCADYIVTTDPTVYGKPGENETDDYSENAYVLQTATHQEDSSRAQSYLGLLTVDKSRYTNTNQIPNLNMGYDFLRVGSESKNSSDEYNTYYTLGTVNSFTAGATTNGDNMGDKPSGWTTLSSYGRGGASVPSRETHVPNYSVSEIDGKYIHALGWAECRTNLYSRWATAGTSVLCSVTDKSGLREAVLNAYNEADNNQDADFTKKLQAAATVLGTPSATQAQIDTAREELNDILNVEVYSLKYDNLFSAYEFSLKTESMRMVQSEETKANDDKAVFDDDATAKYNNKTIIINSNNTSAKNANVYTNFGPIDTLYNIPIKANTEYVFEYDVTTTSGSQAHVFLYDADGNEAVIDSYTSITGVNTIIDHDQYFNFIGGYTNIGCSTHVVIKFTSPANAAEAAFRFGNILEASNKSTFSNIRFVEAKHYSEEIVYSETKDIYTEDLYNEHTAYGTLMSPSRIGFTFLRWLYEDETTEVAATDLATAHTTIYSDWYEHRYQIAYNANSGTGSASTSGEIRYTESTTLNNGSGFSKTDYILAGWSTNANATTPDYTLGQSVSRVTPEDKAVITLYAVWVPDTVNITFDNLIDIKAWLKLTPSNAKVSNVTDTGFTLTSTNSDGGEGTFTSPFFTVEPGKDYKIDIEMTGAPWDVYIFFCDENGNWVDFVDGESNRYSNTTTWDTVFTAPNKTSVVKAQIRVDANSPANPVTFNNIRVYEDTGISVSPVNKQVVYGDEFGTLPTPTKEGYTFAGWYQGSTLVTSTTTASTRETYNLTSKWVANDDVLAKDIIAIDFGSAINIAPLDNDTVLADVTKGAEASSKIVGISKDGATYSATAEGEFGTFSVSKNNVTYTPSKVINGIETVYYQASITFADKTTTTVTDTITVAPASNVLYEENLFNVTNTTGKAWETDGTAANVVLTNDSVYGFDASYNNNNKYSNGSALKVTVDKNNKRSQILSFTFTGTGFNLYGACGSDTGVQLITIKNNTENEMVKSIVVDTYYSDTFGTLNQVPVVSETLPYAEYTVQVMASYLPTMSGALKAQSVEVTDGMTVSTADAADDAALREALAEIGMEYILDAEEVDVVWFDEDSVLNGGMGAATQKDDMVATAAAVTELVNVVDSIRVYSPAVDADEYYVKSEQYPSYYNVIDNLVNGNGGITDGNTNGLFAYVAGKLSEQLTIENYDSIGPKDELYLAGSSNAVTFTVNNFDKNTTKVMISARSVYSTDTAKPVLKVGTGSMTINSNTEMYYDITNYVADDGTVTIQNTATGTLLSVGYVKIVGETVSVASTFNLETARLMMTAPAEEVDFNAPVVEPDVSVPEEDAGANDGTAEDDAQESQIVALFKKAISFIVKVFNIGKSFISKVFSIFSY